MRKTLLTKPIQEDFDPLAPSEFHGKYPEFAHLINLEWAIRQRRENGMLASGCFIEIPYGSNGKFRCNVVPALINQHVTGQKAKPPTEERMIEIISEQNRRLAAMEAQLGRLFAKLEAASGS